ncbi:hypothetical protein LAZ67_X000935 [Cordylochernes scorpioides]|uniref:Uncharacterized protein n=1 Tax=Cordylochernes scorpioides TaxID=51811 RepID=A0ABY6LWA6_9ARAC|nr:hypothetical protein LAZ67_X000935 [Cordylochernes scorpioides]
MLPGKSHPTNMNDAEYVPTPISEEKSVKTPRVILRWAMVFPMAAIDPREELRRLLTSSIPSFVPSELAPFVYLPSPLHYHTPIKGVKSLIE